MTSVLVIGDDLRSFLAIARSLGRKGLVVHAAPFDFSSPALSSRYISGVHRLPPYALSANAWLERIIAIIADHKIDLIIPCDDRSLLPLHHHRAALAAQVAVPNDEAMDVFFDKVKTRALAERCSVPIADGGPVSVANAQRFGLPLALKPRSSMDLERIGHRRAVSVIRDAAALSTALEHALPSKCYFLESFFAGDGVGISVLAENGKIRLAFQHRRLQEASETGGSSSRVSEALDPKMLDAVNSMCVAQRMHGVAMFEFRHNRATGAFVLLEVNARFWGSLALAVASGVDFPAALIDLFTGRQIEHLSGYKAGIERHDLTGEYYRILVQSETASSLTGRIFRLAANLPKLFLKIITQAPQFDSYAVDDILPWQDEKRRVRASLLRTLTSRLPVLPSSRKRRGVERLNRLTSNAAMPLQLLFVCHGNICRSPFAAAKLETLLGKNICVKSVGTLLQQNRHAPEDALLAASTFGINLDSHRSRYAYFEVLNHADVIFIFDDRNAFELSQLGVDTSKLIRLGDLIGVRVIADPYGLGRSAFLRCYEQISAAVGVIANELTVQ